jgi:hypothetical protein
MKNITLKRLLKDWTDPDIARYFLACCLGISDYDESQSEYSNEKHVFWTVNRTSILLDEILESLKVSQAIEFDSDLSQFRWNSNYQGLFDNM